MEKQSFLEKIFLYGVVGVTILIFATLFRYVSISMGSDDFTALIVFIASVILGIAFYSLIKLVLIEILFFFTKKKIIGQSENKDKTVEKGKEKSKDKVVEKIVEKDDKEYKDKATDKIVEKDEEENKDKTVEKIIEKGKEENKDKVVEKIVEKDEKGNQDKAIDKIVEKDEEGNKDKAVEKVLEEGEDETENKNVVKSDDDELSKLFDKKYQEKIRIEIQKLEIAIQYTKEKFASYTTKEDLIKFCEYIEIYSKQGDFNAIKPIQVNQLKYFDVYHFGWNIWNYFNTPNNRIPQIKIAEFLKNIFKELLKDVEIHVIKSHLKTAPIKGFIKIEENITNLTEHNQST